MAIWIAHERFALHVCPSSQQWHSKCSIESKLPHPLKNSAGCGISHDPPCLVLGRVPKPMSSLFELFIVKIWNGLTSRKPRVGPGIHLGAIVQDGRPTKQRYVLPHSKRTEHVVCFGRTGRGKSTNMKGMIQDDIALNRGMLVVEQHDDLAPFMLSCVAEHERRTGEDLSQRLIIINPVDQQYAVGLNLIRADNDQQQFVLAAEFARILQERWGLVNLGARTEEVLRNTIMLLSSSGLTIVEIDAVLTNSAFRTHCLKGIWNAEVKAYFENRYNAASEAMQATMRDPILNKISGFTGDPRFRHIVGQRDTGISIPAVLEKGLMVLLILPKGKLGETAETFNSLLLTKFVNALFNRSARDVFPFYLDEAPNLTGLETMLAESRKYGVSIVTCAQFMDQFPAHLRAAMLSIGTHICFQLSSPDADKMAAAFGGGNSLADRLKNLPKRHAIIKSGSDRYKEVLIREVRQPQANYSDLYLRCQKRWGRLRTEVEAEIQSRVRERSSATREALDEWR